MPNLNVFIKPRLIDGKPAIVRDPVSRIALKPEGEWKPRTQFWTRRILQEDVIDCTKEQSAAQAAASSKPAAAPTDKSEPNQTASKSK